MVTRGDLMCVGWAMGQCIKCDKPVEARELCVDHYAELCKQEHTYTFQCVGCGETVTRSGKKRRYCGIDCYNANPSYQPQYRTARKGQRRPTKDEVQARRNARINPMRLALEAGDHAGFLKLVGEVADQKPNGCWEWTRSINAQGYPIMLAAAGSTNFVHRAVLEAAHGKPLGSQAAHHKCANTKCVNPEHLQPVTYRENTAEMLARHSYLNRIKELEAALAAVEPNHPLLNHIAVA